MEVIRALVVKHLPSIQKGIAENMEKQRRTASGRFVASLRIEEDANNA